MCGDREGESHIHAARIALYWRVEEPHDLREVHDLVKLLADLRPCHAENTAIEINVLLSCKLGMETSADLEQARHATLYGDSARRGLRDPREDFQKRRFAGPVTTDDAYHLTALD